MCICECLGVCMTAMYSYIVIPRYFILNLIVSYDIIISSMSSCYDIVTRHAMPCCEWLVDRFHKFLSDCSVSPQNEKIDGIA